jgi:rhodanese-related sulfurtransferase
MSEDEFVGAVTEGQTAAPAYFAYSAHRNRERHPLLGEHERPALLDVDAVLEVRRCGGVILDTRSAADFATGHLQGSVNVGLEGRFAEYAGDVLRPDQPVALVCEPGTELEVRVRLGRIGFDNVVGALADAVRVFVQRPELVVVSSRVTADELRRRMAEVLDLVVVDVRNPGERAAGAIDGSVPLPLSELLDGLGTLDPGRPTVVYCAGGYRSSAAASALVANGFRDVSDLLGGYGAWAARAPHIQAHPSRVTT